MKGREVPSLGLSSSVEKMPLKLVQAFGFIHSAIQLVSPHVGKMPIGNIQPLRGFQSNRICLCPSQQSTKTHRPYNCSCFNYYSASSTPTLPALSIELPSIGVHHHGSRTENVPSGNGEEDHQSAFKVQRQQECGRHGKSKVHYIVA